MSVGEEFKIFVIFPARNIFQNFNFTRAVSVCVHGLATSDACVRAQKGGVTGWGGHGRDVLETVAEGQSVSVSARHRSRLHRSLFFLLSFLPKIFIDNIITSKIFFLNSAHFLIVAVTVAHLIFSTVPVFIFAPFLLLDVTSCVVCVRVVPCLAFLDLITILN